MIYIKNDGKLGTDTKVKGMQPEILLAIIIADQLMRKMYGKDLTLTSITDGHEFNPRSLHNPGYAFDMRIWGMARFDQDKFVEELSNLLGGEYDIVVERDHIHVEFDPKDIESKPKLEPAALTEEKNQELLGEVYEDKELESRLESRLEGKIDKILEWIKFHGEDMKCKSGQCKFDELEHSCRLKDEHICNAETSHQTPPNNPHRNY